MKRIRKLTAVIILLSIMLLSFSLTCSATKDRYLKKVEGFRALANSETGIINISFKKVKKARGYLIYVNTKKNFKNIKRTYIPSPYKRQPEKSFRNLDTSKPYYFKICAYTKRKGVKVFSEPIIKKVKWKKAPKTTPASLFVNGKDLSHLNMASIDLTNKCARIPLLAVTKEISNRFSGDENGMEWHNVKGTKITWGWHYSVHKDGSMSRCKDGTNRNYLKMPKKYNHPPCFIKSGNDYIVDTHSAKYFIKDILKAKISIDYENAIINITDIVK